VEAEGISDVGKGSGLQDGVVVTRSCELIFTFSGVSGIWTFVGCTSGVRETLDRSGVSSSVHTSMLCRKWESPLFSGVEEIGSVVSTKMLEIETSSEPLELASRDAASKPFRLALLSASRCVRPKTRRRDTGQ
jgi:hypothetical protein